MINGAPIKTSPDGEDVDGGYSDYRGPPNGDLGFRLHGREIREGVEKRTLSYLIIYPLL